MSKRPVNEGAEDGNQAYLKRQKLKHIQTVPAETVQSSRQLQQLLAFDQDATKAKHGIQSFKTFLESLSEDDRKQRLSLLTEYLISQKPHAEEDKNVVYLSDIMQTWSFASQTNNEALLSAIPAALTVLIKSISVVLELRDCGLLLGRTLLLKTQQELIARNLSANKTKAFIISPTLCLLREVAIFDGGSLAKQLFRNREYSLRGLGRNLGLRYMGDGVEPATRPSIRTNAVKFLSSLIKFSTVEAKKELLSQREVVSGLMREISHDRASLIIDTLETLKVHILEDEKLSRESKSKLFTPANLGRFVMLYNYDQQDEDMEKKGKPVIDIVHGFLVLACTSNEQGVLYRQTGFYPKGVDPDILDIDASQNSINLGLESLEWDDKYVTNVPVKNTTLSEFIQNLRPWSSTKQSELLLAIFKAAPELVADYFFHKKSFSFEPKLTATWIGFSAFLFSTIHLDIPPYFGYRGRYAKLPPPSSIIIESILPSPLTQKVLTRCLNQQSPLIRFFATRILVVAFEKLQRVLLLYRDASKSFPIWQQAAEQLIQIFSERCPSIKDVIITFRASSAEEMMSRHASARLLVLYYEVAPQLALESKFDVSSVLSQALGRLDESSADSQEFAMRVIEAENLFQIAHCSPGMRWFNKSDARPLSPFTNMLRLVAQAPPNIPLLRMQSVLQSVAEEAGILQFQTATSSLDALVESLRAASPGPSSDAVYEFLDDCLLRCSTTPVKYIEVLERLQAENGASDDEELEHKPLSLLLITINEQWPFLVNSGVETSIASVAAFLASYFSASLKVLEDKKILKSIIKRCAKELPEKTPLRKLLERSQKVEELVEPPVLSRDNDGDERAKHEDALETETAEAQFLYNDGATYNLDDKRALLSWNTKDIEEAIEEGHAAALVILLSSSHHSIRKEALTNVMKLAMRLKESSYEEKEQIWLLLCEIAESSRVQLETGPVATTITAFASSAIAVLSNPLHCMYPKLNSFLLQGPTWDLDRIPLMHSVLAESPSFDDAYHKEIDWLLQYLRSALQTQADMAIYHKRRVFGKLLSLYASVHSSRNQREHILQILFKAANIPGGSDTLVTRFSILSWIKSQARLEVRSPGLEVLRKCILETADHGRIENWSRSKVEEL